MRKSIEQEYDKSPDDKDQLYTISSSGFDRCIERCLISAMHVFKAYLNTSKKGDKFTLEIEVCNEPRKSRRENK